MIRSSSPPGSLPRKDIKAEILELKKISQNKESKEKYITELNVESFTIDPTIRYNVLKNSTEFKNSFSKLDLLAMRLQFISPETVRKLAVVECQTVDLNSIKGINSIKMGSFVKKDVLCQTCSLNKTECTGHLGYIELADSFIHPLAVDYTKLVLECVCEDCGYLNLSNEQKKKFLRMTNKETYKKLKDISKQVKNSNVCANAYSSTSRNKEIEPSTQPSQTRCKNTIPKNKISYEATKTIDGSKIIKYIKLATNVDDIVVYIGVKEIKEIFKKISVYDLRVMGFENGSTPVNFILEALPVIPERDRPPIRLSNEEKLDDLTYCYLSVLKNNISLKKELLEHKKGQDEQKINNYKKLLWNDIKNLMNNNKGLKKIGSTAIAKTLNTKLSGKKGYCRQGAQTKRVDYAGRTVAGTAPCEFGWVILPDKFKHMTIKEKVFSMNIERIKNMARAGQIFKIIKKGNPNEFYYDKITQFQIARRKANPTKTLVDEDDDENIQIGDTVYRNMALGDDVYINRQPTLHRHNLIGCRTIFSKNKYTMQFNMAYTSALAADFDGDAMNVHVPQTVTARAELRHIMNASRQIISAGNSNPMMFPLFNDPISAYLISKDFDSYELLESEEEEKDFVDYFFSNRVFFNFEDYIQRLKKYGVKRRTPQAVFSMLFPSDFNYKKIIAQGVYTGGFNDVYEGGNSSSKKRKQPITYLGKGDISNEMIETLYIKYGYIQTSNFITQIRYILDFFIERRGFTIGLKDMILKSFYEKKQNFSKIIDEVRENVFNIEKRAAYTEIDKRHKQLQIMNALSAPIDNEFGKTITESKEEENNNLVAMVKSKAQGTFKNITRIMVTVGQQTINNNRPAKTIYGNRSLPYFDVGDDSIESRGFSVNGYLDGLVPAAEFFQSQESRIGLLKRQLETGETGALTKRISKAVESEFVNYDGGVIDAHGNYTCLCYDDGFNREEMRKITFESTGTVFLPFDLRLILSDLGLL